MDYVRIIPCLDVKDGRLVKGIHFVGLRDVADPAEMAAAYSKAGADELVFLDITATIEGRKTMIDVVKRTVEHIIVPLTVGGGIRDVEDIETILDAGASRVSMNSAAVRNPLLIRDAADAFGSDTIVIAIDTRKNPDMPSGFEVMINGGTKPTGKDAVEWAQEAESLGAGQILPTSMDADGTLNGYDIPMTKAIAEAVAIPVIASGGAGKLEHLYEAVTDGKANAVLVASMFHFGTYTIKQAKDFLRSKGIPVSP
ncbi:MAG: imidazole glycerol phosphate synthase subunit HisF [Armatimonadetes bacterium]|nr:imidazole glycerol phosphate synthase subunit HisF [Armatimonadota bacterium]